MKMQLTSAVWAVALADFFTFANAVQLRSVQTKAGTEFFTYDYSQNGADWQYGSCASRTRQSPIDLPAQAPSSAPFTYTYKPVTEPFDVINNGHTLAADLTGLGYGGITYNGDWYNLMNINVHSLSEHAWAGKRKPIELHLVHKHYGSEALLIVAVAVESATPLPPPVGLLQSNTSSGSFRKASKQGPQAAPFAVGYTEPPSGDADFNPSLQAFLKEKPPGVNMKASVAVTRQSPFELNPLLDSSTFYEYAGSLTAPPCAEIATWLVRKDPMKASDKQVLYLHDAIYKSNADFGNYRVLMPLNERRITLKQGTLEDPPKSPPKPVPMPGSPQQSDREFRAMKWSMDALTIARGATNYIKDLDRRVRNAATAHAEALASHLEPLELEKAPGAPQPTAQMGNGAPVAMESTAKAMAGALEEAARQEVDDATQQISKEAKVAAIAAARQAAMMVSSGQGNVNAMANFVVTPAPTA